MSPDLPATLKRIDLVDGAPSTAVEIMTGRLCDIVRRAVASADRDLWRFVVQVRGGPSLLPSDVARLFAEWNGETHG
jgi:hypothetical protein